MNMKKIFAMMLVLCVAVTMFVACGEKTEEPTTNDTTTTETTTETTTTDNTTTTEDTTTDTTTPAAEGTFDNANITFAVPTGWKATEEAGIVTVAKEGDMMSMVMVMVLENTPAPLEQLAEETAKQMQGTVEDATIGANTFKKITAKIQDNEVTNLIAVNGTKAFNITVQNFAGTDEQAILNSIILK
ncbi:MAG: hypothetical protein KA140_06980 [Caldisericia bacterium]|nr:hypothetical protein [Caldisericia bacterium]